MLGIQVCYPFGFDHLFAKLDDFLVREGVVEGNEVAHGFSGLEGKDAKGVSPRDHRLLTPCHGGNYHDHKVSLTC